MARTGPFPSFAGAAETCCAAALGLLLASCGSGETQAVAPAEKTDTAGPDLRVATFNVSLYRDEQGALAKEMREEPSDQLEALRAIIVRADPDILVLNEFDFEESGEALRRFAAYLDLGYDHRLALPSNTGVASGVDLDGDGENAHRPGTREYGNDAFGYGVFPGQYGIALLSRHPIDRDAIRTFRKFLWRDMPGNLMPAGYYDAAAQRVFRLSSKTHADVPVEVGGRTLHMVLAHPTPPGFDGAEDRNGRRNNDEVRLLLDYIGEPEADWLTDDEGRSGGLPEGEAFVIAGDLNADPVDGDVPGGAGSHAMVRLLESPLTIDPQPRSFGGVDAAERQKGGNASQDGDPAFDTGDFSDRNVGNLRVDYVIPSSDLEVAGSGVFWPAEGDAAYDLVGPGYPPVSSDHRLVWVDLVWPPAE